MIEDSLHELLLEDIKVLDALEDVLVLALEVGVGAGPLGLLTLIYEVRTDPIGVSGILICGRSRGVYEPGYVLILGHQAEQLSEAVDGERVHLALCLEELSEQGFLRRGGAG